LNGSAIETPQNNSVIEIMANPKKNKTLHTAPSWPETLSPIARNSIAGVILFFALAFFFRDAVFDGKVFSGGDIAAMQSFETFVNDASAQGVFPLWNPYIFCGMPSYASLTIGGERLFDLSDFVWHKAQWLSMHLFLKATELNIGASLALYLLFGLGMYFLAQRKLNNWYASLFVALAATFSTFIIIWVMVGHMTKLGVVAWFPFIFLLVDRLHERFDWKLSLILAVVLHFAFGPAHIQMLFYLYFALGLYFLFFLVRSLILKQSVKNLLIAGVVLAMGTGTAFLMSGDQYFSTLEYNTYSIRGSGPIQQPQSGPQQGAQSKQTAGGGLAYDYATAWSFSPSEMVTFLIPSAYGFGNVEYNGILSQNQPVTINTYFGPQVFTDAPQYMGIVVVILALIGVVRKRKDPFVQYLAMLIAVSLLISFGKEFSLVYDLMFKYFPMFNKFRIPSMILILVQFSTPLLAGYGFVSLIENRSFTPDAARKWRIALGAAAVLAVLSVVASDLFTGIYSSFFPKSEASLVFARMARNQQPVIDELYRFVTSMVATDITVAFVLLTVVVGSVVLYRSGRITVGIFSLIILLAAAGDLYRVSSKRLEYTDAPQVKASTAVAPDYVKFLQQDTTLYRTLEFVNGQPPYSNDLAYWRIQSAYGYQGAKMRAWQDMVDVCDIGNPLMWGLMNVKYVISDRPDSNQVLVPVFKGAERAVMANRFSLPRTFFVNKYETASGLQILDNIRNMSFNPKDVLYLTEDPHLNITPAGPGASARYVKFGIQDLTIEATATGNNLLFLSEVYYPNGWKAFIDGNETPIYRADYLFRAVVVPPGTHTITMTFEPKGFYLGKNLSLALNLLVLGALGILYGKKYVMKKK
jgi:hypothetical protein